MIKCLEAAIRRRISDVRKISFFSLGFDPLPYFDAGEALIEQNTMPAQGISLELCGRDRVGLLSDVTRVLRENGLSVTRAGVSTVGEQALDVFYVRDASGYPIDAKTIEALRQEIGQKVMLNVRRVPGSGEASRPNGWAKNGFSLGSFFERFLN